jgi:hypothetical protein
MLTKNLSKSPKESKDAAARNDSLESLTWTYYGPLIRNSGLCDKDVVLRERRESEGFLTTKSRPLHEKLGQLIDWIAAGLGVFTATYYEHELMKKLHQISMGLG